MTALVLGARNGLVNGALYARALGPLKLALVALLTALLVLGPEVRGITLTALADAYLQVSVFVAATLGAIYFLEERFGVDLGRVLERYRAWQVPVSAALGALPGCGGAVAVVTQYVRGNLSFGAVVAVLTATMGDAAFLLLAAQPLTGLGVFALGFAVGVVSGYTVDRLHGRDFLRMRRTDAPEVPRLEATPLGPLRPLWAALLVPGFVLGVLDLAQVDTDALFGPLAVHAPTQALGVMGALLAVAIWALNPIAQFDPGVCRAGGPFARTADATNFVTVWVILGFLAYGVGTHATGIDLAGFFEAWAPLLPVIAVLVGFLPGCGPQIVVTTLYIAGAIPLSAQLGNAISNDGDALFPAIALAPRVAVVATLYSAVPAVLVAYGWFLVFE